MITIPTSYSEVKLGNYLNFVRLQHTDSTEIAKSLATLLGISYEEFIEYPDIEGLQKGLSFLNVPLEPANFEDGALPELLFTYKDVCYTFVPHILHLSFGQLIDFEAKKEAAKDNLDGNIDLTLATMLCIEGIDGYKETRLKMSIEDARKVVLEMPTQQAYDLWIFFFNRPNSSQNGSSFSMGKQAQGLLNQMSSLMISTKGTGGTQSLTTFLRETYLTRMRFIVYLSEKFSLGVIGAWKRPILTSLKPHLSTKTYNELHETLSKLVPSERFPNFYVEYNKFLITHRICRNQSSLS